MVTGCDNFKFWTNVCQLYYYVIDCLIINKEKIYLRPIIERQLLTTYLCEKIKYND